MPNPIRHLRKLLTPPCSACRHYGPDYMHNSGSCYSKRFLDHEERVSGMKYTCAENTLVRGTRFCTYEPKGEADAD